jgi:hypothetical protein
LSPFTYEKNQVKQNGKIFNNTFQKSLHPEVTSLPVSELYHVEKIEVGPSEYAHIWHCYGSADFVYVFWLNKYGVVASS